MPLSTKTIRTRLHENGLRLDHSNRFRCLERTRQTPISLDYIDRRVEIWQRPGEGFRDATNIAEHDLYGGGSIIV